MYITFHMRAIRHALTVVRGATRTSLDSFGRGNTLLLRGYIIIIIYRQHEYRIIITTHMLAPLYIASTPWI